MRSVNWKRLAIGFVVVCGLLVGILKGLYNYLSSPNFGIASITLRDGSKIFVKHEQWGLHEDELSVTRNSDGCVPPSRESDFIDTYGDGNTLIYSEAKEGLVLYEQKQQASEVTMHVPDRPWVNIKVEVKQGPLDAMEKNPDLYGAHVLSVPINQHCWINIFRKVETSLRNGR
jgi:hypothetical protein